MTKKEFKKKWENYWYHYKTRTWVIIFVIIALCYTVYEYAATDTNDMTITYIGKFVDYKAIAAQMEADYKNILEDADGNGIIEIGTADILASSEHFEGDMLFWQRIDINVLNGRSYIYLVDEPVYEYLVPRRLLGKIQTPEGMVDYIDVTENEYFSEYISGEDRLYLCVRGEFEEVPDKEIVTMDSNSKKVLEKILEKN